MNPLKKLIASKVVSSVLSGFSTSDKKTTILGVIAAALLASKIDISKLIELDPNELANAAGVLVLALHGFYTNKGVSPDVRSFLKGEEINTK